MLWIKAFHLIFVITWFAGLFYLPRLFVYHSMSTDSTSIERFKIMERKLFYGIMTPSAVLTVGLGFWLLKDYGLTACKHSAWLHLKLSLVLLLVIYHAYCGYLYRQLKLDKSQHTHTFYRWLNEFPTVILIATIVLTVVKPF